ncbi:MAG: hypothetical protein WBC91_25895, partial [Phototrophicaceae bacterium]
MNEVLAGIDIGGTRCALVIGQLQGDSVKILDKRRFATPSTADETLQYFSEALDDLLAIHHVKIKTIGIS